MTPFNGFGVLAPKPKNLALHDLSHRTVVMRAAPHSTHLLSPFLHFVYSIGRRKATGALLSSTGEDLLPVKDGEVVTSERDPFGRHVDRALRQMEAGGQAHHFRAARTSEVPGRRFSLTQWVRRRVENELNFETAARLGAELQTARISLWPGREPDATELDVADERIVSALRRPRSLAELSALSRAPRFRLLGFLLFARAVGALLILPRHASGLREKILPG